MALDPKTDDWTVYQGRTFKRVVRWETTPTVFKAITGINRTAPVEVECVGHGLKSGWYVAITDVNGMTEINAPSNSPRSSDFRQVTVVDSDNFTINDLSAAQFAPYTSGGYVRYNTPKSLASADARLQFRDRVGGTELLALTSVAGDIVLDDTEHVVVITITDDVTKLMEYTSAVYDLEIEDSAGETYVLLSGSVEVIPEVTVE